MQIRRARESEAEGLSALALRSKAVWGYSTAFLESCRPLLTVTPSYIGTYPIFVAERADSVVGFYSLKDRGSELELDLLFVEPAAMGQGIGSALLQHALRTARELGRDELLVESDPGAELFYAREGGRRIGSVRSTIEEGRELPLLAFSLAGVETDRGRRLGAAREGQ